MMFMLKLLYLITAMSRLEGCLAYHFVGLIHMPLLARTLLVSSFSFYIIPLQQKALSYNFSLLDFVDNL